MAFGVLLLGAIKDVQGKGVAVMLLAFVGCTIACIIILWKILPEAAELDIETIFQHSEKTTLNKIELPDAKQLKKTLLDHGFVECEDGFLRKKKFSFMHDYITYYVYITEGLKMVGAVSKARDLFEKRDRIGKNKCILLFAYMNLLQKILKDEVACVKEYGKLNIVFSNFMWEEKDVNLVPVLVEKNTKQGYYLPAIKVDGMVTIYKKACKMVQMISAMK